MSQCVPGRSTIFTGKTDMKHREVTEILITDSQVLWCHKFFRTCKVSFIHKMC